jgi:hypothetical protein
VRVGDDGRCSKDFLLVLDNCTVTSNFEYPPSSSRLCQSRPAPHQLLLNRGETCVTFLHFWFSCWKNTPAYLSIWPPKHLLDANLKGKKRERVPGRKRYQSNRRRLRPMIPAGLRHQGRPATQPHNDSRFTTIIFTPLICKQPTISEYLRVAQVPLKASVKSITTHHDVRRLLPRPYRYPLPTHRRYVPSVPTVVA